MRVPTPYWVMYKARYTGNHLLKKFANAAHAHTFCAAVRNIPAYSTAYVYYANG